MFVTPLLKKLRAIQILWKTKLKLNSVICYQMCLLFFIPVNPNCILEEISQYQECVHFHQALDFHSTVRFPSLVPSTLQQVWSPPQHSKKILKELENLLCGDTLKTYKILNKLKVGTANKTRNIRYHTSILQSLSPQCDYTSQGQDTNTLSFQFWTRQHLQIQGNSLNWSSQCSHV